MRTSLTLILALIGPGLFAQTPGSVALEFNPADVGYSRYDGIHTTTGLGHASVYAVARQADGKLVIGGNFYWHDALVRRCLTRALPDGSVDSSFAPPFINNIVSAMAVQPDGKVIVGGNFDQVDGLPRKGLARLHVDGSLDTTFHVGLGFQPYNLLAKKLAIMPDGRIYVAGNWDTYNGVATNELIRLLQNGDVDPTFNTGTGFDGSIAAIQLQTDGELLVAGAFTMYNGTARDKVARLAPDGTLDASFAPVITGGSIKNMELRSDGRIWLSGLFNTVNGQPRNRFVLLTASGATDPSFVPADLGEGFISCIAAQADGRLLVGYALNEPWGPDADVLRRFNADGSVDAAFTALDFNATVEALLVQPDQRIVVVGDHTRYGTRGENAVTRLMPDATVDPEWAQASAFDDGALSILRQPDGKYICTGVFYSYYGTSANRVVRLLPDGTLDPTFTAWNGIEDGVVDAALQPDGKVIIGGHWYISSTSEYDRLARLNTDGSLDTTFRTPTLPSASRVALQPDGKVLVIAGNIFTRLLSDGSPDNSFQTGTGFNGSPQDFVLLPNGRIVVVGWFSTYNGSDAAQILRLNSDGSVDNTFTSGTGFEGYGPLDIERQPDGKLLCTGMHGAFYNGNSIDRVVRLSADGVFDPTFDLGEDADDDVDHVHYGPDGMLYIYGDMQHVGGVAVGGLARLFPSGTVDPSFVVTSGGEGVADLVFDDAFDLVVVGGFTQFNEVGRNRITKVHGGMATSTATKDPLAAELHLYPDPARQFATLEGAGEAGTLTLSVVDMSGRVQRTQRLPASTRVLLDLHELSSGAYVLDVLGSQGVHKRVPFLKE